MVVVKSKLASRLVAGGQYKGPPHDSEDPWSQMDGMENNNTCLGKSQRTQGIKWKIRRTSIFLKKFPNFIDAFLAVVELWRRATMSMIYQSFSSKAALGGGGSLSQHRG